MSEVPYMKGNQITTARTVTKEENRLIQDYVKAVLSDPFYRKPPNLKGRGHIGREVVNRSKPAWQSFPRRAHLHQQTRRCPSLWGDLSDYRV